MTPEQITEQLEEIISNIADAHILIYRLQQNFDLARRTKGDQAMSEREKLVDEVALDLFRRQHPTPGPEREKAWLMYGADYVSDVTETIAAIEAAGVRLVPVEATHKMNDEPTIEPYENKMTLEELREEVRRCWDAHHELSMALKTLPDMPGHAALRLLNDYPRGAWPRVWELGKEEQRRLTDGCHFDDAKNAVPYKAEYEIAAGIWSIIRDALRKEFGQ